MNLYQLLLGRGEFRGRGRGAVGKEVGTLMLAGTLVGKFELIP